MEQVGIDQIKLRDSDLKKLAIIGAKGVGSVH
jgi:hypothetical protein